MTEAVEQFEDDGFLCLRQAVPVPSEWITFAEAYFLQIFRLLYERGHTAFPQHVRDGVYALGLGIKEGFREVVMRSPGRYELSMLHQEEPYPSIEVLEERILPRVSQLLHLGEDEVPRLCNLSLVVSAPGSSEQSWHADGGHCSTTEHLPCHVLNVFVPLIDVTESHGPTEFRPGSHYYTRNLGPMMLAAKCQKRLRPTQAPTLTVGDILLFDYRVLHRGRANQHATDVRTFLVLTYGQPWFHDVLNFPKRSMMEFKTTSDKIVG